MESDQRLMQNMPLPRTSMQVPPYVGDEYLRHERTFHRDKSGSSQSISYLLSIEAFLLKASDADFELYVQHCRAMIAHPQHSQHPKVFLGLPTGPNTNQLFARGDRWIALASVRQCRCEMMARMGRSNSWGVDADHEPSSVKAKEERRRPGCKVM